DPDDRVSHSAYADYLMEQNDPRGEFIRVQLALEDATLPGAERTRLKAREAELLANHQKEWLGPLEPFVRPTPPLWGPPDGLRIMVHFARGWIDRVELDQLTPEAAQALCRTPPLALLRELVLGYWFHDGAPDQGFGLLAKAPYLGNVRRFVLGT